MLGQLDGTHRLWLWAWKRHPIQLINSLSMFPFWIDLPVASLLHGLAFAVAGLSWWLSAGVGRGLGA